MDYRDCPLSPVWYGSIVAVVVVVRQKLAFICIKREISDKPQKNKIHKKKSFIAKHLSIPYRRFRIDNKYSFELNERNVHTYENYTSEIVCGKTKVI